MPRWRASSKVIILTKNLKLNKNEHIKSKPSPHAHATTNY